ncbi:hypothetical protein Acr_23g0012370 [Actinidia rufa]|uniref:Transposase (putative) gypsy type domain-containing protein n=1 Tax=Actinidia rufa TaxID=165716 RepID=A0A7J0GPY3_9ERIC|nr:hypothetical protein Acr_23g0012370 [Actinidia rufa]
MTHSTVEGRNAETGGKTKTTYEQQRPFRWRTIPEDVIAGVTTSTAATGGPKTLDPRASSDLQCLCYSCEVLDFPNRLPKPTIAVFSSCHFHSSSTSPNIYSIYKCESKLEIRVEIFRRDFRAIQLRKCIPVIKERFQEKVTWGFACHHRDYDGFVIRRDLRRRFWRDLVETLSILPRPRARRKQYPGSWRADEHSGGGSGELSGDDLAKFHELVLPRSRGFGDKHRLGRSRATSSEMARDTYSFPSGVQIKLPDEGETITSTRPGEVAFYEAAFPAGLRFPVHNTIRLILQFYNICPAQLVPNAWRSIACSMAFVVAVYRYSISLSEFRNLFSLNSNPKPDQGWLYFKARNKKVLLGGYPSNVKGWKSKFFLSPVMNGRFLRKSLGKAPARVPRTWGIPNKHCNNPPRLFDDKMKVFEEIFRSIEESGRFSVPVLLDSKSFRQVFASPGSRASRTAGDHPPSGEAVSSSSDVEGCWCELGNPRSGERGSDRRERGQERASRARPARKQRPMMARKEKGLTSALRAKRRRARRAKLRLLQLSFLHTPRKGPRLISALFWALRLLSWAARLFREVAAGVISPADKEKVDKLTLDQTATKLFHVISQALVLGSSLAVRSREAGEQASLQEGRVASMETEVARLQKLATDFEQQLAKSRAREQQSLDELAKAKGDRDSLADHLGKSGALVNELREALNKAKESAVEEFKSSSEFMVAVEDAASKYFGEGFNFCKVQLCRHHPDLAVDLEGTVVDQDLLAELDEAEEENDKGKTGEHDGGKK